MTRHSAYLHLGIVLIAVSLRSWAQTAATVVPPSVKGVVLITPNSPEFDQDLQNYFPDVAAAENFAAIRPLSVIVLNHGSTSARAYSVVWNVTTVSGQTTQLSRAVVRQIGGAMPVVGKQAVLARYEAQLVTPVFDWSSNPGKPHPRTGSIAPLLSGYAQVSPFNDGPYKAVSQQLDGVLGTDHIAEGPDVMKLQSSYTIVRNAEHDEGLAVMKLLLAKVSTEELIRTLQDHARQSKVALANAKSLPGARHAAYQQARSQEAAILLAVYQRRGIGPLRSTAYRLQRISPENFTHK